jgi:hypothetical protein
VPRLNGALKTTISAWRNASARQTCAYRNQRMCTEVRSLGARAADKESPSGLRL